MSANRPTPPAADRNLLFGILVLQMDFVGRDALLAAMNAWVLDKAKPLGQVLVEQKALDADARSLLEALVDKHVQVHGDAEKSLAAMDAAAFVHKELNRVAEADLQASLQHLPTVSPPPIDPESTRLLSAGGSTSSGQRFRVLRPHAKGGLGEVFVAYDEELQREVALKEIQDKYAHSAESRTRFLLEAQITGGLGGFGTCERCLSHRSTRCSTFRCLSNQVMM